MKRIICFLLSVATMMMLFPSTAFAHDSGQEVIREHYDLNVLFPETEIAPIEQDLADESIQPKGIVREWRNKSITLSRTEKGNWSSFAEQSGGPNGRDWMPSITVSYAGSYSASISSNTRSVINAQFGAQFTTSQTFGTQIGEWLNPNTNYKAWWRKQYEVYTIVEQAYYYDDARMEWVLEPGNTRTITGRRPILPELTILPANQTP